MAFWRSRGGGGVLSLDEFVGDGEERAAAPLDLERGTKDWERKLGALSKTTSAPSGPRDLVLQAFTLIRGGDLFEASLSSTGVRARTDPTLVSSYADAQLRLTENGAALDERDAALRGILRVLEGNAAVCRRMLIAKPISVCIIPRRRDYREFGFPRNTNPHAVGIFWNSPNDPRAMIGLREERIVEKPWLMVHEMMHAVHMLALTIREREDIDRLLMPVYQSRRWVEEAVAIYAERAFGAKYTEAELRSPDLYGKTRRDWDGRHVFSRFMAELLRPDRPARRARR